MFAVLGMAHVVYAQQVAGDPGQVFSNIAGLLFASNFNQWSIPEGTTPINSQIQWPSPKMCQPTSGGTTFQAFQVGSPITIVDANPSMSENVTVTSFSSNNYGCQIQAVMQHTHYSYRIQSATAGLQEALDYASNLPYEVVVTPDWARSGGTTYEIVHAQGNYNVTILDQRSSVIVPYLWNGTIYVAQPFNGATPCGSIGDIQASGAGGTFECDPLINLNTVTHNVNTPLINSITWPTNSITVPNECFTVDPNGIGKWLQYCVNPNNPGFQDSLAASMVSGDTSFTLSSTSETGFGVGYLFIDSEWIYYTGISGSTVTVAPGGRGYCGTTPTTHSASAYVWGAIGYPCPLGVAPYSPTVGNDISGTQVMGINNPYPSPVNGQVSLNINQTPNSTYVDRLGGIHQLNPSANYYFINGFMPQPGNEFAAPVWVGSAAINSISDTSYIVQTNQQNNFYQAQSFSGSIAGPLSTTQAPSVGAPTVAPVFNVGTSTWSYVCQGVDSDSNLIPGATGSTTTGAATLTYPAYMNVKCPFSSGSVTYKAYRTAGGPNIGLLGTVSQQGGFIHDTGASLDGSSPSGTNGDVPRLCNNSQQFCALSGTSGTPPLTCTSGRQGWEYHITSATSTPFVLHCVNGSSWTTAY